MRKQRHSKKTNSKNNTLQTDIKKIILRRDIYAMGIVLDRLMGFIKKEKSKELHSQLRSLTDQMLEVSWEKSISASQALAEFKRIFSLPDLSKAI